MRILVQKFGGTSLATEESRSAAIVKIIEAQKQYDGVVVVVSAMGRLGAPYATDTLLSLLENKNIIKKSYSQLREQDLLLSVGEIISAVVMSNQLQIRHVHAVALTGGQAGFLTDRNYQSAEVLEMDTRRIKSLLEQGCVPVVAGFQGCSDELEITTIGRGGSDTSAAYLGAALLADAIEIYTDVEGIMTADPRVCEDAKTIEAMSYTEVFQMADSGAKVIHPRAVDVARRAGIPLIIKNTFSEEKGTHISHSVEPFSSTQDPNKVITSIAHRNNRLQVLIEGEMNDEVFFEELAKHKISIDIINIFPRYRVFTTDSSMKQEVVQVLNKYPVSYQLIENCCKITVIGEKMAGVPGVMAKIIKSLSEERIEILQTADSLSTIACLIKQEDLNKAVGALHKAFQLA